MRIAVAVALLLLSLSVRSASLIAEVESDLYQRPPVPERWIPADHAAVINSAREYPREPLRSIEIADFVRVYGVPTYLASPRSNKGYSFLVYEMADGFKLLVHIGSVENSMFLAAQLYSRAGNPKGRF
jgi:hypothetical protein